MKVEIDGSIGTWGIGDVPPGEVCETAVTREILCRLQHSAKFDCPQRILCARLTDGMLVYVSSDVRVYKLESKLTLTRT